MPSPRNDATTGRSDDAIESWNLRGAGVALELMTCKAMDGLYKTVVEEEKQIRHNPVAPTTDRLLRVFGALQKWGGTRMMA